MEWWKGYFWRAIFDRYQYIVSFWPYANIGSERTRPLHHSTQHTIFIDQSVAIIYIMNLRGIRFEKGRTIYKKTDRFIFILLFFSIRTSLSLCLAHFSTSIIFCLSFYWSLLLSDTSPLACFPLFPSTSATSSTSLFRPHFSLRPSSATLVNWRWFSPQRSLRNQLKHCIIFVVSMHNTNINCSISRFHCIWRWWFCVTFLESKRFRWIIDMFVAFTLNLNLWIQ